MRLTNYIIGITLSFLSISAVSQQFETEYFKNNKSLGGDVIINSANIEVTDKNVSKTFEIDCAETGNYYLSAWLMAPQTPNGYPEYQVFINGTSYNASLKPTKDNWQSISLTNKDKATTTIPLKKGVNTISIIAEAPEVPNIEFIKLSVSALNIDIPDTKYTQYIEDIREKESSEIATSIFTDTTGIAVRGTAGQEFTFALNLPIYYTTYKTYSFTAGQNVSVKTTTTNAYEHIIELFQSDNPASYTWAAISSGYSASLNVQVPVSGLYYIRVRAYRQYIPGLVGLNINNGQYVFSNCPVQSSGVATSSPTGANYFTCKLTGGDTRLWLEYESFKIKAHNDDYRGTGDFNWGTASRVKQAPNGVRGILFSAHSSNNPTSYCDLYGGLDNSNVMSYFPNLKADDAIRTAPASTIYNCISWTGDITNYWEWPASPSSSYWTGNALGSFDNFYNSRGYTRTGATATNAAIALWGTSSTSFTHGSITKNTVSQKPHGYSWESKPGSLMRTMHPKDALNNSSYGSIQYYYKPKNTRSIIEKNLMEEASMSSIELNDLLALTEQLPNEIKSEFIAKYNNWEKTWQKLEIAMHSDPGKYAESQEYEELLSFCQKTGKASWPLAIEKLAEGDFFSINLLFDLTLSGNKSLLEEVKKTGSATARSLNSHLPSPYSNAINYAKKLMQNEKASILAATKNAGIQSNTSDITVSTNESSISVNMILSQEANISVNIYDIYGTFILADNSVRKAGKQIVSINTSGMGDGVYLVNIKIGEQTTTKKITIKR